VKITDDTLTISLTNASVVDQFQFPGGAGNNLGTAGVPATVSFSITYTKSGMPRHIRPISDDPLSPFNWAGEMWEATNSGTFSLVYNDRSFSAQGNFSSGENFGEMGKERNGVFVRDEADDNNAFVRDETDDKVGAALLTSAQPKPISSVVLSTTNAALATDSPKFKGRVPIESLLH